MAFDDAKKYADKLGIKNIGLFDQGDPSARRGPCWSPWCRKWGEDLRADNRCHEPECDQRLWQEAVKAKMAIRDPKSRTYLGCVDGLLTEPTWDVPIEHLPPQIAAEMCVECAKELKRTKMDVCNRCFMIERSSNKHNHRRTQAQVKPRRKGLSNKIRGLEQLKGKVPK